MADSFRPSERELKVLRSAMAARLTDGLDRGVASLDEFYLRIESEWRARFELNWELYSFAPDLLERENRLEIEELDALLLIWQEWEEFEYCSIVKEIIEHLRSEHGLDNI
jgi:hypothetical protein